MLGAYHVSKFGLVGMADTLRAELAPSGIRVILVEPGAIATPSGTAARQPVMNCWRSFPWPARSDMPSRSPRPGRGPRVRQSVAYRHVTRRE